MHAEIAQFGEQAEKGGLISHLTGKDGFTPLGVPEGETIQILGPPLVEMTLKTDIDLRHDHAPCGTAVS